MKKKIQIKMAKSPKVVFMCGPAGSGKSTYAAELVKQGFERFSFDEESFKAGIGAHPLPEKIHAQIEERLIDGIRGCLARGKNAVLDFSFWSKKMRDKYKVIIREFGIEPVIVVLETPKKLVLERIAARRGVGPHDMQLSPEDAEAYYDNFENPTDDEGEIVRVKGH